MTPALIHGEVSRTGLGALEVTADESTPQYNNKMDSEDTAHLSNGTLKTEHVASPPKARKLNEPEFQTETRLPASTRLRKMLTETDDLIVCPGVYDGLSARIALDVGFDALCMTGAGTTTSRLGQPDLGIAQLADMRANAEMIGSLNPDVPLVADMDTGGHF